MHFRPISERRKINLEVIKHDFLKLQTLMLKDEEGMGNYFRLFSFPPKYHLIPRVFALVNGEAKDIKIIMNMCIQVKKHKRTFELVAI